MFHKAAYGTKKKAESGRMKYVIFKSHSRYLNWFLIGFSQTRQSSVITYASRWRLPFSSFQDKTCMYVLVLVLYFVKYISIISKSSFESGHHLVEYKQTPNGTAIFATSLTQVGQQHLLWPNGSVFVSGGTDRRLMRGNRSEIDDLWHRLGRLARQKHPASSLVKFNVFKCMAQNVCPELCRNDNVTEINGEISLSSYSYVVGCDIIVMSCVSQ